MARQGDMLLLFFSHVVGILSWLFRNSELESHYNSCTVGRDEFKSSHFLQFVDGIILFLSEGVEGFKNIFSSIENPFVSRLSLI